MSGLPDEVAEPLTRWRQEVEAAAIPRSAREYAAELEAELTEVVATGRPSTGELAHRWRAESGTDRRGRVLRILDRLGFVDRALRAVEEARGRAEGNTEVPD